MSTDIEIERGDERRESQVSGSEHYDRRAAIADRRQGNNRQYATFYLEGHYLGVEVENVQEVFTAKEMTPVPLSSPMIAGLINLRGQIIITIDLRRRLGFQDRPPEDEVMSIVVRTMDGPVNLLVDRIGDVIEVRPDLFEPPPQTLEAQLGEAIEGVYKLEGQLLLALSTELASEVG